MSLLPGALWGALELATAMAAPPSEGMLAAGLTILPLSIYMDTLPWAVSGNPLGPGHRSEWAWHLLPLYGPYRGLRQTTGPGCPPGSCSPRGVLIAFDSIGLGAQFIATGLITWGAVGLHGEKRAEEVWIPRQPQPGDELLGVGAGLLLSATLVDAIWFGSLSSRSPGGPARTSWAWHLVPVAGPISGLGQAASMRCADAPEGGCDVLRGSLLVLEGAILGGQLAGGGLLAAGGVRRLEREGGSAVLLPGVMGRGAGMTVMGEW